eukprot:jgi/Chrzof1/5921/Cz16g20220.t1
MAPSTLVWELVKHNNAFLRKNMHNTWFSAEPGNLYNKHSYKYSGIANDKTVDVSAEGDAVKITKARSKNAQKPAAARHAVVSKKNARRALKSVAKEVAGYRPDLKVWDALISIIK